MLFFVNKRLILDEKIFFHRYNLLSVNKCKTSYSEKIIKENEILD